MTDVTITAIDYDAEHCEQLDTSDVSRILEKCRHHSVTWIDIRGYTDANAPMIEALGKQLELHPLAVEDVLHLGQRTKTEDYSEFLFVVLHDAWHDEDGELQISQLSLFVGAGFVLTLHAADHEMGFQTIRERILNNQSSLRKRDSAHLAWRLIDACVDRYFPVVDQLSDRLDEIGEEVENGDARAIQQLHQIQRQIIALRRLLRDQHDACAQLRRVESGLLDQSAQLHVRDVLDHSTRLLAEVEELREVVVSLRDLHLSTQNQKMNEVIKVLTVISTIFIPLSFFAGVYGMNFHTNMPELESSWGYPVWWLVSLSVAAGMLVWFWRKGWIFSSDDFEPEEPRKTGGVAGNTVLRSATIRRTRASVTTKSS
ncbi:MAG: magnesium/cobalt transporter CorA [Planctomycetota bacterium]